MGRKGLLWVFLPLLICLHAMAMSESSDNTMGKGIVYGFSPDRSRWIHFAYDFDDTIYYYDVKSVLRKKNTAKVWIKFGEPVNDARGTRLYKEASALKEINCEGRLIKTLEWHYISMKEEHKVYTSPTKWENIEPETVEDALLEEVCTQPRKGNQK